MTEKRSPKSNTKPSTDSFTGDFEHALLDGFHKMDGEPETEPMEEQQSDA